MNNAFALDLETSSSSYPVYLNDNLGGNFGKIWVIDAAPKLISIKVENNTYSNFEGGIILYDKYIQWNGKNINDLKLNSLTWKEEFSFFSYILPIEERYVIILTTKQESTLDKVTLSYNQMIHNELIGGAIVALVGVFVGAISGTVRDMIKDANKTRTIRSAIKFDLEHIKNIIDNAKVKEQNEDYLLNNTKISSINTRVYDDLHLEITRLLFQTESNRIRTIYQRIREMVNPQRLVLSDSFRVINKTEIDSILDDIEDITRKLQSFYVYRLLGKAIKEKIQN